MERGNGIGIAADCVFIEWCDRPNHPEGTVGRTRNSGTCRAQCSAGADAIFQEFFGDAITVCGGLTNQVVLRCF